MAKEKPDLDAIEQRYLKKRILQEHLQPEERKGIRMFGEEEILTLFKDLEGRVKEAENTLAGYHRALQDLQVKDSELVRDIQGVQQKISQDLHHVSSQTNQRVSDVEETAKNLVSKVMTYGERITLIENQNGQQLADRKDLLRRMHRGVVIVILLIIWGSFFYLTLTMGQGDNPWQKISNSADLMWIPATLTGVTFFGQWLLKKAKSLGGQHE